MILTALEMQGFKSFPEKTVLKFGSGVTAVVGPNGSGKSNISDAVRWVLGEQSTKSLRSGKMEDVIFDGTSVRKAQGFAQVTLRLDNKDRAIESVDDDEVAVTRRYFRSGESEYLINGKNVRLRDVHELFMDTGLGKNGYSLISQGAVADLVSGKGSQCRDMLEEACGISAYRYRRNDSIKRLQQAQDNMVRLKDILQELEQRVGPLKIQSEKAKKFLDLSEKKKNIEISLWLYDIDKLKTELRKFDDNLLVVRDNYQQVQNQLEEIEQSIDASITAAQEVTAKIEQLRVDASSCEEQAAELDSKCAVLTNSIEHTKQDIERIKREKDASLNEYKQIEIEIESETKLILQLKKKIAEKEESCRLSQLSFDTVKAQRQAVEEKIVSISKKSAEGTKHLTDLRVSESTASSSLEEIHSRSDVVTQLLSQRKDTLNALRSQTKEAAQASANCKTEIQRIEKEAHILQEAYDIAQKKADALKVKVDTLSFDARHVSSKIDMLKELEKNMEGYSGSVKAVIKESKKGALSGIHATVGNVISTENAHTVAIETALGAAVQNIICSTEDDAKKAITFLKRTGAGRATFQPITAVKGKSFDEKGLDSCNGFIGIASELVTTKEEYRNIISALLGKTVVMDNLDNAVAMAKKYKYRFRIVTLDGQVVNPGGSMTGGSQLKSAGILSRSAEITRLNEKYSNILSELQELKQNKDKLTDELSTQHLKLTEANQNLTEANQNAIKLAAQQQLTQQQFLSAQNSVKELEDELTQNQQRIAELDSVRAKAKITLLDIANDIEKYDLQLKNLSEQRDSFSHEIENINANLTLATLDLHDAQKDLRTRIDSSNALKIRQATIEDKTHQMDFEIQQQKDRITATKEEIDAFSSKASALRAQISNNDSEISALQLKRTQLDAQNEKLRIQQKDKTVERERLGAEQTRLDERRNSMSQEYDDTLTKLYDEYQLSLHEANQIANKTNEPTVDRKKLNEIKNKIRSLGSVNVSAVEEYKQVSERYEFMNSQLTDIEKSRQELTRLISDLTDKMSGRFREQFGKINDCFGKIFRELFGGGKAQILLVDPTNVLESDIDIQLQPPGKNVKHLESLSGGEKGLSAISLLFAILTVNPAPFCIFDEVEAALDDSNVIRYAQYVRRMAKNTQFILITHRRGTMEQADMLYGVTMQEQGVSKLLELNTAEFSA